MKNTRAWPAILWGGLTAGALNLTFRADLLWLTRPAVDHERIARHQFLQRWPNECRARGRIAVRDRLGFCLLLLLGEPQLFGADAKGRAMQSAKSEHRQALSSCLRRLTFSH